MQLINAVSTLERHILNQLHVQLMELRSCKGQKQCNLETDWVSPQQREGGGEDATGRHRQGRRLSMGAETRHLGGDTM
ncbi:hypothetical protein JZ751_017765, partial [Albula glossodonta]